MRKSAIFLILISLTLSLSLPVLYGGLRGFSELRRLPAWAIPLLLFLVVLGWCCNAARLMLLADRLGVRIRPLHALSTVISTEFAWSATPAGSGGPPTYVFLLRHHGLPIARGAAMATVDQFVDLIFFTTSVPIALFVSALNRRISHPVALALLVSVLMITGVGMLVWLFRQYRKIALWIGRLSNHVIRLRKVRFRMARWLIQFRHTVRLLISMGMWRLSLLYLFCVMHWMLRYSVLPILLWFVGKPLSWGYLFVAQLVLNLVGIVTFLPGGGGGVELGFSAFLHSHLSPALLAFILVAWRFCTFYWYLLAGAPVFALTTGKMAGRLVSVGIRKNAPKRDSDARKR
ncbi:MAG: lysylphosphatidylglycerol synthase transmembrane domain-containing protein [Betaproteobacteria bacterium]|nr:lysylphosphatidylglycerol synthase transmembrane domain-containing protein [Betaproteobacteria bacterium]